MDSQQMSQTAEPKQHAYASFQEGAQLLDIAMSGVPERVPVYVQLCEP